jgi:uncharacterized protein with GYD domain
MIIQRSWVSTGDEEPFGHKFHCVTWTRSAYAFTIILELPDEAWREQEEIVIFAYGIY